MIKLHVCSKINCDLKPTTRPENCKTHGYTQTFRCSNFYLFHGSPAAQFKKANGFPDDHFQPCSVLLSFAPIHRPIEFID